MIQCPCGAVHETIAEAISHAHPGDIITVVPEAVTIHSLTVVSEPHSVYSLMLEPGVGLMNRPYRCKVPIPLGADSLRFSYSAPDYLRILVECPDRGIVMDGDISPTGVEWRQRLWSLVSSVGVPMRLTFASSLPFGVDQLSFGEAGQCPPDEPRRAEPLVDSDRSSLEDWAQAVDRLCAEMREAPVHD